jgi:hypothetical protein
MDYTNASEILDELQKRVTAKMTAILALFPNIDLDALKMQLKHLGLTNKNAFLKSTMK